MGHIYHLDKLHLTYIWWNCTSKLPFWQQRSKRSYRPGIQKYGWHIALNWYRHRKMVCKLAGSYLRTLSTWGQNMNSNILMEFCIGWVHRSGLLWPAYQLKWQLRRRLRPRGEDRKWNVFAFSICDLLYWIRSKSNLKAILELKKVRSSL